MTFPGASATIYTNEAGEPLGWDYPSDDPRPDHDWWADDMDCQGEDFASLDEFCCGPYGCCDHCCGTDEDRIRGSWHDGCDIGS